MKFPTFIMPLLVFIFMSCSLISPNEEAENIIPVVEVFSNKNTVSESDTVFINASADAESGIDTISIYIDSVIVEVCHGSNECTYSSNNLKEGEYSYYATAVESSENNNSAKSETKFFTITPNGSSPEVSSEINKMDAFEGQNIMLTAYAEDDNGIAEIRLLVNSSIVKTCYDTTSCSFSSNSFPIGDNSYFAEAIDSSSARNLGESSRIEFTVRETPPPSSDELRIMPLGDSITEAHGYRVNLWNLMAEEDYTVDYVGSRNSPNPALPDTDHEGHGGWNIGNISDSVNGWISDHKPNIILLMIGTNDTAWWSSRSGAEIADSHNRLVGQILDQSFSNTWVVVSTIPPQSSDNIGPNNIDRAVLTEDYNREMKIRMENRISNNQNVVLVDTNADMDLNTHISGDGIHPSQEGYKVIAENYLYGIMSVLEQSN